MVDKVLDQANQGEVADRTMAMTGRMEEMTITGAIAEMIWVDMIEIMIEIMIEVSFQMILQMHI